MTDYTPTTKNVREGFAFYYGDEKKFLSDEWKESVTWASAAFDRWLKQHENQVTIHNLEYAEQLCSVYEGTATTAQDQLRKAIQRLKGNI